MSEPSSETRPLAPAFAAFFAAAAGYWLVLMATLWLPLRLLGRGLGPLRFVGGLLMPGVLLALGAWQRGRAPALHSILVLLAFGGALAESVAHRGAPHDAAARALMRMMTYAYAGAALHAAITNAAVAFRAGRRTISGDTGYRE